MFARNNDGGFDIFGYFKRVWDECGFGFLSNFSGFGVVLEIDEEIVCILVFSDMGFGL